VLLPRQSQQSLRAGPHWRSKKSPCAGRWGQSAATVGRLIEDVYVGKLHPRIGSGLAPLLSLQLRAIETADHERRLEALEKRSAGAASEQGLHDKATAVPDAAGAGGPEDGPNGPEEEG